MLIAQSLPYTGRSAISYEVTSRIKDISTADSTFAILRNDDSELVLIFVFHAVEYFDGGTSRLELVDSLQR